MRSRPQNHPATVVIVGAVSKHQELSPLVSTCQNLFSEIYHHLFFIRLVNRILPNAHQLGILAILELRTDNQPYKKNPIYRRLACRDMRTVVNISIQLVWF